MSEPALKKSKTGETQYNQLAKVTTIVADTGDVEQIKQFKPTDATTVRESDRFFFNTNLSLNSRIKRQKYTHTCYTQN